MDQEMIYQMFFNTLKKMDEIELENALKKAKGLLNKQDYESLVTMIQKEKEKEKQN